MKNKKTIILLQNVDFPQQGAIDIFYYIKYLSQYDDIHVICIVSEIVEDIKSAEVIEMGSINYISFIYQAYVRIRTICDKHNVSYVYFFAQHPGSVLLQFLVKHGLGLKTVYDVVSGPIGTGVLSYIARLTLKLGVWLSDKYVVLDLGLIDRLQLPLSKSHIDISMGYDEQNFSPAVCDVFSRAEGDIIFTYIGSLDRTRGLDIFVDAFVSIVQQYPYVRLYIVGTGNHQDALMQISKQYLGSNIFFLGQKAHADIPSYINSSDVMISYIPMTPYFDYQMPTKTLEYLGCDKPVIATNTKAQKSLLHTTGLLHDDDLQSTKDMLQYVVNNVDDIRSGSYHHLAKGHTWKELIGRLKEFLF